MGTRQKRNRHDDWVRFCQEHSEQIKLSSIPSEVFSNEYRFIDFLTDGCVPNSICRLADLDDEEFLALEKLVNAFLYDGWYQLACTALQKERLRRFSKRA